MELVMLQVEFIVSTMNKKVETIEWIWILVFPYEKPELV